MNKLEWQYGSGCHFRRNHLSKRSNIKNEVELGWMSGGSNGQNNSFRKCSEGWPGV